MTIALIVAGIGILTLTSKFERIALQKEITEQTTRALAVEAKLLETHKDLVAVTERMAARLEEVSKSSEARTKDAVIERFDVATGRLTERRTTVTTAVRNQERTVKSETTTARDTKVETTKTVDQATKSVATETSAKTEVSKPADVRMGVTAGVLVTAAGAGPAMSYELVGRGPLHLDAIAGVLRGQEGLSPRAGLSVVAELTPRLSAGAVLAAAPAGDPLGIYHPLFPWAGVSPGLTVGYRF